VVTLGVYSFVGLGSAEVMEPSLPKDALLNPDLLDDIVIALAHIIHFQWLVRWIPVKVVGSGLAIQFSY
jgi:hypothetical protein